MLPQLKLDLANIPATRANALQTMLLRLRARMTAEREAHATAIAGLNERNRGTMQTLEETKRVAAERERALGEEIQRECELDVSSDHGEH